MRKLILTSTVSFVLFSLFLSKNIYPWDNEITHIDLSKYAADNSVLSKSKDDYLKNLGFNLGVDEIFTRGGRTWTVTKWLREGAFLEDEGSYWDAITGRARYTNHFHNPLKPWSMAGLSDLQSGESSVLWAQDSEKQGTSIGGDWSWQKVRLCYHYALTATNDADRQAFFACTFQGLGYQMHLIQDTSQPAHVRNDAHPMDGMGGILGMMEGLETWAKKKYITINSFAVKIMDPAQAMNFMPQFALNVSPNGFVPITQFIDSDQYDGTMPSTSLTWGLAEYTNSNFASDDTIFTEDRDINDKHYFPYPRYSANSYETYEVDHSLITKRIYLKKKGDGENVDHFATVGPLFRWLSFDPVKQKDELKLDPLVYKDYAEKLIPHAVGYSSGLLNYFFRGEVEFSKEVYEQITAQVITGLYLKVKNLTPNEEMKDGEVFVSYKYKPAGETEFTYGLSNPVASGNIPYESETFYNFIFSTPIPVDATEVQYLWVFKGTLGQEVGAVVGKVIPEPCHITGEWLCKQDEGVTMILSQAGNNITGTWTDLLVYCSPPNNYVSCIATGAGTYDSSTRDIDMTFNTEMDCCCPQLIYEGTLVSCDCMAGKLSSGCNPTTDATFTRKGSGALCPFP